MTTIYHSIQLKIYEEIRKPEKNGYKFINFFELILITYNSIRNSNPVFYKNLLPKPMFMTKILQLIDRNPDNFKNWVCDFICVERTDSCDNKDPVSRFVCYEFYS